MKITENKYQNFIILTLHEEIDLDQDLLDLEQYIEKVYKKGNIFIALKFSHVSYIYSGIIKIIIRYYKKLTSENGILAIVETNKILYDVLDIIGITKIMKVYKTEEEFKNSLPISE